MGLEDRDWYREEKRQQRQKQWAQEAKAQPTPKKPAAQKPRQPAGGWNGHTEHERRDMLLVWSVCLNVVLAMALIYMATT